MTMIMISGREICVLNASWTQSYLLHLCCLKECKHFINTVPAFTPNSTSVFCVYWLVWYIHLGFCEIELSYFVNVHDLDISRSNLYVTSRRFFPNDLSRASNQYLTNHNIMGILSITRW